MSDVAHRINLALREAAAYERAALATEAEANKVVDLYESLNNDANAELSAAKMAERPSA